MKNLIIFLVLIFVVAGGYFVFRGNYTEVRDKMNATSTAEEAVVGEEGYVITYTDEGYAPSEIEIMAGDEVTFKNDSTRGTWPATAQHPTHTVYPESDIKKCFGDAEPEVPLFDSCGEIAPGDSWSFTFTEVGEWGYHDHVNAGFFGKVIVQ